MVSHIGPIYYYGDPACTLIVRSGCIVCRGSETIVTPVILIRKLRSSRMLRCKTEEARKPRLLNPTRITKKGFGPCIMFVI